MENKELQELFAAKRTSEANRRRQEELRQMMDASAAKKSRRLWPVWFGAVAAAVLLLLIALPTLFRQSESSPLMVAQVDTLPLIPAEEAISEEHASHPLPGRGGQRPRGEKKEQAAELVVVTSEEPHPYPSLEETAGAEKSQPVQEIEQNFAMTVDKPDDNAPRIHRRTSTSMVCSNCSINNVPSQENVFQNFLAATFGTEPSTPLTLTNIEL